MMTRRAFSYALMALLLVTMPALSQEMTKKDYVDLPARSWKHFRCGALYGYGNGYNPLGQFFTQKGYLLGKQYYKALNDGTITIMDLTLDMPAAFNLDAVMIMSPDIDPPIDFKMGRVSVRAETAIFELIETNDNKGRIDFAKTSEKAKSLIEGEKCDYDDLKLPPQMLNRFR
ncbi:hypothetical protein [Phyllobacterium sp. K27]